MLLLLCCQVYETVTTTSVRQFWFDLPGYRTIITGKFVCYLLTNHGVPAGLNIILVKVLCIHYCAVAPEIQTVCLLIG